MDMIIDYLARWGHFLFGITWIGLLYYFNFIQGEYFKEADGDARVDAFTKLVPRALWYFRWAAICISCTRVKGRWAEPRLRRLIRSLEPERFSRALTTKSPLLANGTLKRRPKNSL